MASQTFKTIARLGACAAAGLLTTAAFSDIIGPAFSITAITDQGSATWTAEGEWDGDAYTWSSNDPVELRADDGQLLATLNPTGASGSGFLYYEDPQVSLDFSVMAGPSDTMFVIDSALLSFPTITGAEGRASAAYSLSDLNGNGAALSGTASGGVGYLAQYNGFVPGGTTFAGLISGLSVATPFGSDSTSEAEPSSGFALIGDPISDMSVRAAFSLSAGDLASGTTTFVVVPEPTTCLLLCGGLLLIRRR